MKLIEGGFEIDASQASAARRLDVRGQRRPKGMQLADLLIEHDEHIWLIEIKDPARTPEPFREAAMARFRQLLSDRDLIDDDLVPKARDSYTYLHLMAEDHKPMGFVCLLGLGDDPIDAPLLLAFRDRLLRRLRREAVEPWKRRYVADCLVLNEAQWPALFPDLPLRRIDPENPDA